jgi:hypothetical protein
MENINSNVTQSLQEIATLLLMIHETYIFSMNGTTDILTSLCKFLTITRLDFIFSIVDIEFVRRIIAKECQINLLSKMEYEHFYIWLREIAKLYYSLPQDVSGGGALHFMLLKYIVPILSSNSLISKDSCYCIEFESLDNAFNSNRSPKTMTLLMDKNILEVFVNYFSFLTRWYAKLTNPQVQ